MNKFKPISKSETIAKIKSYLLDGFIIREDGRDETPLEVISREYVKNAPIMHNIGQEGRVLEEIDCSHELLYSVLDELEEDYSVRRVHCSGSGCGQYATYANYID